MITGFEEETYNLTDREIYIAKKLADAINRDPKKHQRIKLDDISLQLENAFKEKFPKSRVGKIIQYIRAEGLVIGLCADNKGYYVYETKEDFLKMLKSLKDRLDSQIYTYKSMVKQFNSVFGGEPGKNKSLIND